MHLRGEESQPAPLWRIIPQRDKLLPGGYTAIGGCVPLAAGYRIGGKQEGKTTQNYRIADLHLCSFSELKSALRTERFECPIKYHAAYCGWMSTRGIDVGVVWVMQRIFGDRY